MSVRPRVAEKRVTMIQHKLSVIHGRIGSQHGLTTKSDARVQTLTPNRAEDDIQKDGETKQAQISVRPGTGRSGTEVQMALFGNCIRVPSPPVL